MPQPAVSAGLRRWRPASPPRRSGGTGQSLDVEFVAGVPGPWDIEALYIRRGTRERPRGNRRVFRVEQHLVPHSELHVPLVSTELRLAPVLPILHSARTSAVTLL